MIPSNAIFTTPLRSENRELLKDSAYVIFLKITAKEAYELSANLKRDDIKDIFTKDYIIDLLNNIL